MRRCQQDSKGTRIVKSDRWPAREFPSKFGNSVSPPADQGLIIADGPGVVRYRPSDRFREGRPMRARYACSFALLITLAACAGKKRPFADTPIEGLAGSSGLGNPAGEPGTAGSSSGRPPEHAATGGEPLGGAPVDALDGSEGAVQNSGGLACEADPDACKEPDAGPGSPACIPGPRDCTSEADNDCDGRPDNVFDDVCACLPGAVEPCDEHPGLDGRGPCRAGTRRCVPGGRLPRNGHSHVVERHRTRVWSRRGHRALRREDFHGTLNVSGDRRRW